MKQFLKKWCGIILGTFGLLAAVAGYYISPESVFTIGKFPTMMLVIGFILVEGTVIAHLWKERDNNRNKSACFGVKKVVQTNDNSVVLIIEKDEKSLFANSAMSIYLKNNEFEGWLGLGGIVNSPSDEYYQVLVSGLNDVSIRCICDKNIWSNLRVKSSFPFDTLNGLIIENSQLANKLNYYQSVDIINNPDNSNILPE